MFRLQLGESALSSETILLLYPLWCDCAGAVQDTIATIATMGLSQWITALIHVAGDVLDLGFTAGHVVGDLVVEENKITLSRINYFLVKFRIVVAP